MKYYYFIAIIFNFLIIHNYNLTEKLFLIFNIVEP